MDEPRNDEAAFIDQFFQTPPVLPGGQPDAVTDRLFETEPVPGRPEERPPARHSTSSLREYLIELRCEFDRQDARGKV